MDMTNKDAKGRIQHLFVYCKTILQNHGLLWLLGKSEDVAVEHVLSSIRPDSLRKRLSSNFTLKHRDLEKGFKISYNAYSEEI